MKSEPSMSPAQLDRRPPRSVAGWVLISSILASSMAFIDGTAMSVALPALQADLAATGANLLWVTNGFSLPLAALLLFGGALGDAWGRRRVFMAGIVGFAAASLGCGLAPDVTTLITARVAQGVAGALMIPGSLAMISSHFGPAERGKAIGRWSAFSVLATTLGPVLGGLLAGAGLWRGVFFINLPVAAIALAVLVRKIPPEPKPAERASVDWWGALAVTIGLASLNHGVIQGSRTSFGDPTVVVPLLMGVAALALFVFQQARLARVSDLSMSRVDIMGKMPMPPHGRDARATASTDRATQPLLPLEIFRSRTLRGASLLSLLFFAAFHGTLFFVPLNLIQVQGYAPALAGATQLPLMALLVLMSPWAGRLVDRRGPRLALTIGPAIAAVGFLLFAWPGVTAGPQEFATTFLPGFLLVGAGLGLTAVPLNATVMTAVSSDRLGLASGINSSLTRLAGVCAVGLLGPIVLMSFSHALAARSAALPLEPAARVQLQQEAVKLADAQVPEGLDAGTAAAVEDAIKHAFVDGFRLAVTIAAALSAMGAVIALRFLPESVGDGGQEVRRGVPAAPRGGDGSAGTFALPTSTGRDATLIDS
jgi:MFS family permease